MFTYEINQNNEVLILIDGNDLFYQTRYPDGTEWNYEEAEQWALSKIAFIQNPENTPDAPDSPLT
jgi:hypothetical protein